MRANRLLAALCLAGCAHGAAKTVPLALAPAAFTEPAAPSAVTAPGSALPYAAILDGLDDAALRTNVRTLLKRLGGDSANAELRDELGRLLVDAGHPAAAIAPLQDALYLRPGRLTTAAVLAEAYVAAQRGPEALALAARLVHERPYQDDRWLFRAEIERRLGMAEAALASASRCLLINPNAAAARAVLGYIYVDRNMPGPAKKLLGEAAAGDDVERAPLEHRLGTLAMGDEDWQGALEHLERSLAAKPGYAAAHNDRGVVYTRLGRWSEAKAEFTAALTADPLLAEAHLNLANLLIDEGAKERAVAEMKAAHGVGVDPAAFFLAAGRLYAMDASTQTGRLASLEYLRRARGLVDPSTQSAIDAAIQKIGSLPPAAPSPASLKPIEESPVSAPGPARSAARPPRPQEIEEFRPAVE